MKHTRTTFLLFPLLAIASCAMTNPSVVIETEFGDITAEIFADKAPITASAFMKNVDEGIYANKRGTFYRVVHAKNQPVNPVRIAVIQGGIDRETGDTRVPPIPHETTAATGLTHRNGTLSMAREAPGTANTEFAICVGPQPELDFGGRRNPDGQGFAAFGRVTSGMETVHRIHRLPDKGQYLVKPLPILAIRRE